MKPQSAKAKGRKFQQYVRSRLLGAFEQLKEDDIQWRSMGAGGEDLMLSPAARELIPCSFECKNQEKLNIWEAINQTQANAKQYNPVCVFKRNHTKPYVVIDFDYFLKLLKK